MADELNYWDSQLDTAVCNQELCQKQIAFLSVD